MSRRVKHNLARRLRVSAYHEAGHVVTGVAVGFGVPNRVDMVRRGDSLARVAWKYDPLARAAHRGAPQRTAAAMYCLAGYVSECRARGWRNVDAVQYCERRSAWIDGRPVPDDIRPDWWAEHADIDRVALLYSSHEHPRPLPHDVLRDLWRDTATLLNDAFVWSALADLAAVIVERQCGVERDELDSWLSRFQALDSRYWPTP